MAEEVTTVQLSKSVVKALKRVRRYPRETYNEIILDLIKTAKKRKIEDEDYEFWNTAQQVKMKELWGEGDYTAWENV